MPICLADPRAQVQENRHRKTMRVILEFKSQLDEHAYVYKVVKLLHVPKQLDDCVASATADKKYICTTAPPKILHYLQKLFHHLQNLPSQWKMAVIGDKMKCSDPPGLPILWWSWPDVRANPSSQFFFERSCGHSAPHAHWKLVPKTGTSVKEPPLGKG